MTALESSSFAHDDRICINRNCVHQLYTKGFRLSTSFDGWYLQLPTYYIEVRAAFFFHLSLVNQSWNTIAYACKMLKGFGVGHYKEQE